MIHDKLPALKAAAETYRKEYAALQSRWDSVDTMEQADQLKKEETAIAERLRIAFYEVTSDINRRDSCMDLDTHYILQFADRHTSQGQA